jgi:hypothetical protein
MLESHALSAFAALGEVVALLMRQSRTVEGEIASMQWTIGHGLPDKRSSWDNFLPWSLLDQSWSVSQSSWFASARMT